MKRIYDICLRYILILVLGLGNLYLFYLIFTPTTTVLVNVILKPLIGSTLIGTSIILEDAIIQIVPACVAGAAYYLLFILAMSVPEIPNKKRIIIILSAFISFLLINVFRIVFLVLIRNNIHFDFVHSIFWYLLSTVFVVLIWFLLVKLYKIKNYPVISDVKYLFSNSLLLKKAKNPKVTKKNK